MASLEAMATEDLLGLYDRYGPGWDREKVKVHDEIVMRLFAQGAILCGKWILRPTSDDSFTRERASPRALARDGSKWGAQALSRSDRGRRLIRDSSTTK